jgi:hypothetical protein
MVAALSAAPWHGCSSFYSGQEILGCYDRRTKGVCQGKRKNVKGKMLAVRGVNY